ncbi:MAG: nucleotidyltransferase family protein [Clostridiaceae bacterium]|nr:nucleotidyltransferase family protein [Clostridiaceae bacterium]
MKGILLAAGYATRLYPLTKDRPKALLPVGGRPILDYIVDEMNTIPELDQIVVISNHRFAAQMQDWAHTRNGQQAPDKQIIVVDDMTTSDDDKLGAIGDISFCIDELGIDDDVVIIAGDNLFTYKLADAWEAFRQRDSDMILIQDLPPNEDPRRFAIVSTDENGYVTDMVEKPKEPLSRLAAYATYFYKRETLPLIREYLISGNKPDAPGNFPAWLHKRQPVYAYEFQGVCIDIGTPESYEDVRTTFPSVHDTGTV